MIKKILKHIFPLPAGKQREIENKMSQKVDFLQNQLEVLEDRINTLINRKKYKIQVLGEAEKEKRLKEWYFIISKGKKLNLKNPKTFTDKINWLKIHDKNPMKSLLSDKYLASQYIDYYSEDDIKTMPILGVWEDAYDIDFNTLPEKFVLKCTHGSSWNIIVKNKIEINLQEVRSKLNNWLSTNYTEFGGCFEWNYENIKPRIVAVKFFNDGHDSLLDYKVHCFNGVPRLIEIQSNHYEGQPMSVFFTPEWKKLKICREEWSDSDTEIPLPKTLPSMLNCSRKMSKDFIYVRIDFYSIEDKVYFGEFTFFPGGGYLGFKDHQSDIELGEMLHLPG